MRPPMVVYIASFAFSLGPVVWTMIAEIFPSQVRGKAVAVSAAVNWGAAFVVSATFLSLIDAIGAVARFLAFAVLCVVAIFWIAGKVPETKGKSLGDPGGVGRARCIPGVPHPRAAHRRRLTRVSNGQRARQPVTPLVQAFSVGPWCTRPTRA